MKNLRLNPVSVTLAIRTQKGNQAGRTPKLIAGIIGDRNNP
jgi:hypothetical protein